MKKIFIILVVSLLFQHTGFSKENEKLNVNSQSFMDLSRYVETFETNEAQDDTLNEEEENISDINFEQEAINDLAKRYENNAVELKLDDDSSIGINDVNSPRIFSLKVNETQYKIENGIKAENMIWDSSKSFSQAIFNDSRHLAPIPSVINSQKLTANVSNRVSAKLGQTNLYDSTGNNLLFIRANESTYNTGSVLDYNGEKIKMSVGSFSSSYDNSASGGAIFALKPFALPKKSGNFTIGGGCFTKEMQNDNKTTGGLFGEYNFKRLKLNAQIAQSKFANSDNFDTGIYFVPEFRLSDSLALKTRLIRNISQNISQDELVLSYKPVKSKNNLEFEINASNQYNNNDTINQRLKFSTSFKI